jgi:DNA-binding transcriptional LysR family regulator
MEIAWLEDFVALVDAGNFSRAAERRNLTQPAFSRRIKALEEWVGATLFDRGTHRVVLTEAGEKFRPVVDEILRRLYLGREEAREAARGAASTLRFAATHALSLTFFPDWLRSLEADVGLGAVQLVANHMQMCERIMLQGEAQFLLCHHHPAAASRLTAQQFQSVRLGIDKLLPVTITDQVGGPRYALPGSQGQPVPFLAFSKESGIGQILEAARALQHSPVWLETVFTSHLATVLKAMVLSGRGIAWSPTSLIGQELQQGVLVRAGDESWDIDMEIRLYRPRSRQSDEAEDFWSMVSARSHDAGNDPAAGIQHAAGTAAR